MEKVGIVEPIQVTEDGYEVPFKSNLPYFHPKRHIPPTNPTGGINMSPVDGYLFTACLSMQNVQWLTNSGGVNKYPSTNFYYPRWIVTTVMHDSLDRYYPNFG